jgi:ABC-type multidrug transport system ATPase subunit
MRPRKPVSPPLLRPPCPISSVWRGRPRPRPLTLPATFAGEGRATQARLQSFLRLSSKHVDAPIITLNSVVKQFGRFAALRGVTAEFSSGRLYAILGDNGAGKTTLLRALAGLAQPTRGHISIFGTTDLRTICRELGYMAHPSLLYDEMTGMENLHYFGRLYGITDDRSASANMTAVGLDPALMRPVAQYSQGMRQRLSLARALLNDPKLLLLDEPFSNVDAGSAREMVGLLAKMRTAGKTIVVVTHQASLLETVADEFVWMEAGQITHRTSELRPAETQ